MAVLVPWPGAWARACRGWPAPARPLLAPFAARDGRWGQGGALLARLVLLPGHILNLFALALLALHIGAQFTLLDWAALAILPGTALAVLAALASAGASGRPHHCGSHCGGAAAPDAAAMA